jgi:hypothetical protein
MTQQVMKHDFRVKKVENTEGVDIDALILTLHSFKKYIEPSK